jgi:hypothetical protein
MTVETSPQSAILARMAPRFVPRRPESARFWLRYAPRAWEGPEQPWLDLAAGRLGRSGRSLYGAAARVPEVSAAPRLPPACPPSLHLPPGEPSPAPPSSRQSSPQRAPASDWSPEAPALAAAELAGAPELDDLVYLPPVPARLAAERDELARRVLAGGAPVLVQLVPGDTTALPGGGGVVLVFDLLASLLAGDLEPLGALPRCAAAAVWPLVAGLTDDPDLWERGCRRLAVAGVRCVQAVAPALAPGDRRRLAAGRGEAELSALYHREPPGERQFAILAYRHGLAPFLPRPLPRPPLYGAENRRVAGLLALAAELWVRLERPVEPAQGLFRAARWLDGTPHDAAALHREGNLAVVPALDPVSRQAVVEAIDLGEPALLAELLAEYLVATGPELGARAAAGPKPMATDRRGAAGNAAAGRSDDARDQ